MAEGIDMKLKYSFETMELDDHFIAVPVGDNAQEFKGVIRSNESGAAILDMLKEETTIDSVVDLLSRKYGDDLNIESYVNEAIEYLRSEGVIE